ncbi:MAG TPA: hypothetical protein VMU07_01905 [Candidatus Paceibacterota bacterium]|nr:hypothetical protein [Candidatus Paceibacterota bacterium]
MDHIRFLIREGVSAERLQNLLEILSSHDDIAAARRTFPEATDGNKLRDCFACLEDDRDHEAVMQHLRSIPEIEDTEYRPDRAIDGNRWRLLMGMDT